MTTTLAAEAISVSLGERAVLDNISASIAPGEFVAVVGANGAGKSTFLKSLAGLIAPDRGRVLLDGAPLSNVARRDIARPSAPAGSARR